MNRLAILLVLVFGFVFWESQAKDYVSLHSIKPPYTPENRLAYWEVTGTAAYSHKYIRFNPLGEDAGYIINTAQMKLHSWESRTQTWTGGPGDAGYSIIFANTNNHLKLVADDWDGVALHFFLQKREQNQNDTIHVQVEGRRNKQNTLLAECSGEYPHNPNLFVHLKYFEQKLQIFYAYEIPAKYQECLAATVLLRPGYYTAFRSITPKSFPVERQDFYAFYLFELSTAPAGASTPEPATESRYVPPKASNFETMLKQTIKKYERTKDIPMAEQVVLYNEFFRDIAVIDEQHEHLKGMTGKIKDLVVELQMEQEDEHSYFEEVLSRVVSEAATSVDIRELINTYRLLQNATDDQNHPANQLSKEVHLLKELVAEGAKKLHQDLEDFGTKIKAVKNSLDISHNEHKSQISGLNTLTAELARTVEENSAFGFWTFFILFQLMFFLGFTWWFKIKSASSFKKDY